MMWPGLARMSPLNPVFWSKAPPIEVEGPSIPLASSTVNSIEHLDDATVCVVSDSLV